VVLRRYRRYLISAGGNSSPQVAGRPGNHFKNGGLIQTYSCPVLETEIQILERCGTTEGTRILRVATLRLKLRKNGGFIQTYSCPVLEYFLFLFVEEEPQSSFRKE